MSSKVDCTAPGSGGTKVGNPKQSSSSGKVLSGSKNSTDDPPINKLDGLCLRLIFDYLPLLDRLRVVKVCKRWNEVGRSMWRSVQELDVLNGKPFKIEKKHRSLPVLKEILQLSNVKKLKLQANKITKSNDLIKVIASMCPKLEELVLYKVRFDASKLATLEKMKNLKMLGLHDCNPLKDSELTILLKDKPFLTHLEVTTSEKLKGKFLRSIQLPLETLVLARHPKMDPSYLWDDQCPKHLSSTLQHLNISCVWYMDCECEIDSIKEQFPNLKSLTLGEYNEKKEHCMGDIIDMKNLELLNVSFNFNINDVFLRDLVQSCQKLTHLDISGTRLYETSEDSQNVFSISGLNQLPNLKSLNLSFLDAIPPDQIGKFASISPPIEYLYLVDLVQLKDTHVKDLFSLCRQLRLVDFSNCTGITDSTITAANEAVAKRINNLSLCLVVGGTEIDHLRLLLEKAQKKAQAGGKLQNKPLGNSKSQKKSQAASANSGSKSVQSPTTDSVKKDSKSKHPLLSVSYKNNCTRIRSSHAYGFDNYCSDDECTIEDCADGTKDHHKVITEEDQMREIINQFGMMNQFPGAGGFNPFNPNPDDSSSDDGDNDDFSEDDDDDDPGPRAQYIQRPQCPNQ